MQMLLTKMDVLSNNLANASTAGYKRKDVFFRELISQKQSLEENRIQAKNYRGQDYTVNEDNPYQRKAPLHTIDTNFIKQKRLCCQDKGYFVSTPMLTGSYTDNSAGRIRETGNPLNIAITSERGYFTIQTPEGQGYTRNGEFSINSEGYMVNANGYYVLGESGPIQVTGSDLAVSPEGHIIIDNTIQNKFLISDFNDTELLQIKNGLVVPKDESVKPEPVNADILQGYVEDSNVSIVREMVGMITTQRHYESNSKLMTSQDHTLQKSCNDIGK